MRYEDDALRFCTRDGSPLVHEKDFANTDSLDFSGALPERARDTEEMSPIERAEEVEQEETEVPRIVIRPRKSQEESERIEETSETERSHGKRGILKTVLVTAFATTIVLIGGGYFGWIYAEQLGISIFFPKNQLDAIAEPSPEPEPPQCRNL